MKKHESIMIKTCGRNFADIKDWYAEICSLTTQLSDEEKASEYAKYYLREIAMPSHELLAAAELNNCLPPDYAFRPEEYVKTMDSSAIDKIRTGYCIAEDGTGFSTIRIRQEGITDEKLAFFNENFNPEGDLFYKCWYPGMHMRHYEGGAVEDTGSGMELIRFMSFISLDEYAGVKGYKVKDPLFAGYAACGGVSWPLHKPFQNARYSIQADWWRELPDGSGREEIIVFWNGMKWEDGRSMRTIPPGEMINIEFVRALMNHSIWETVQMTELVKRFWDDNH